MSTVNRATLEHYLAVRDIVGVTDDDIKAFLLHLIKSTQFRHEIKVNKKCPLNTVIPENAFTIFFLAFMDGQRAREREASQRIQLNQEALFPFQ